MKKFLELSWTVKKFTRPQKFYNKITIFTKKYENLLNKKIEYIRAFKNREILRYTFSF